MIDKRLHLFRFRGGVLEPSGTCEIKFKMKDLVRTMKRLDDKYCELSNSIAVPGLQRARVSYMI